MWQELIRIPLPGSLPDFVLPAFGVMMVVGFLVALQVAKMLARRSGLVLGAFGLIEIVLLGLEHTARTLAPLGAGALAGWLGLLGGLARKPRPAWYVVAFLLATSLALSLGWGGAVSYRP